MQAWDLVHQKSPTADEEGLLSVSGEAGREMREV